MPTLDRLRGYYLHAPTWFQSTGGRVLSLVPADLLYGESFRRLRADIARSEWDSRFVEDRVRESLGRLLLRAGTAPYYAESLAAVEARSVAPTDLSMLPILTRETVRQNFDGMLAIPRHRLDESMTSGTSEASLTVYLDKDRSVREWAFVTHAWQRAGYRLGDRRAVLRWGHALQNVRSRCWAWEPGTRELRLSPLRMVPPVMDEYLELLARFRIAFVHGYPSAITLLAKHASRVGWSPPPTLKGVLPISEALLPYERRIIREGFGPLPIVPFYGLTEKVAFATEVPGAPDFYDFEPLYGVAEVVGSDGRQLGPGQRGRLIGTGFVSTGMPLVRYFTGDLATVVRLPTADNCWRLRATELVSTGRQDYLVTAEGGLVATTFSFPYNEIVREKQFVQRVPGRVTLRVVPEAGVSRQDLEAVSRRIRTKCDGLLTLDLEIVDELPTTSRGKRVYVEQYLALADYGVAEERCREHGPAHAHAIRVEDAPRSGDVAP